MENSKPRADLLLKNVSMPCGVNVNLGITGNLISSIGDFLPEASRVLDCSDMIAIPPFVNAHTHAAMTLFRGWGDDLPLHVWLNEKIWPAEAKLTQEDVYIGTRLACLEMIKTGTTFFNDMYWHPEGVFDAIVDSGIRGMVSGVMIDMFNDEVALQRQDEAQKLFDEYVGKHPRVTFALGPHAVYTVSEKSLAWCGEKSRELGIHLHVHLCETEKEVQDCHAKYGISPVELLHRAGMLGSNLVAAHCVWLSDRDVELLAQSKVTVAHIPASNMKLAVGREFNFRRLRDAGVKVIVGTDGCASNNNLDMFSEVKLATLIAKSRANDPVAVTAKEMFKLCTASACESFGLNFGNFKIGDLADIVLLNARCNFLIPSHDGVSNIVYSATDSCVDTVICDGKILMENRVVEGEKEIIAMAQKTAMDLCNHR